MRDYIRLSGVLLIVCVIAAALLGFVNDLTAEKIDEQIISANNASRQKVLANADEFVKLEGTEVLDILAKPDYSMIKEIYQANSNGTPIGYTVTTTPRGYGGAIEIIVGIDKEGKVLGVSIGSNNETPGLGKNAEKSSFTNQYINKSWDSSINVVKNGTPKDNEIVAISGATITSNAVTQGVNKAMAVAKELSGK